MTIRREPTYLSTEVWRCCWLIAKGKKSANRNKEPAAGEGSITPDEVADTTLRKAFAEQFPQLLEHLKAVDKLEDTLIKTLGEK